MTLDLSSSQDCFSYSVFYGPYQLQEFVSISLTYSLNSLSIFMLKNQVYLCECSMNLRRICILLLLEEVVYTRCHLYQLIDGLMVLLSSTMDLFFLLARYAHF